MTKQTLTLQDIYDSQQAMHSSLKGDIKALHQDIRVIKAGQDGLSSKVDDLREYTEAGFDTMNDRFDRVESRVDRVEDRVDCLSESMDRVEAMLGGSTYQH